MAIFGWIRNLFSHVPLIGSLPEATRGDHREAVRELLISLLISMAPVYIGALALHIAQRSSPYLNCAYLIIQNGELFMYSAATLAPVMYIVTRDRYDIRSFPSKFTFMGVVIVCALVATCIFTIERVKAQVLPEHIIDLSLWVYGIAVGVFYLALVYNNTFVPNPAARMRKEEGDYVERYRQHRP